MKAWKKTLSSILVLTVLLSSGILAGSIQKAEGAEYPFIKSIKYQNTPNGMIGENAIKQVELSNGTAYYQYNTQGLFTSIPITAQKQNYFSVGQINSAGYVYLKDGDLFTQIPTSSQPVLHDSNVVDYATLHDGVTDTIRKISYFVLKEDSSVWAWGYGSGGELAVGTRGDRTVPFEVLAPDGEPLVGIKKMYSLAPGAILFISDNAVYLVGSKLGVTTIGGAFTTVANVSHLFPAFTSSDNFEVSFINDQPYSRLRTYKGSSSMYDVTTDVSLRLFKVNGRYYSLANLKAIPETRTGIIEGDTLIPVPENINAQSMRRYIRHVENPFNGAQGLAFGITTLTDGQLGYWGTEVDSWTYPRTAVVDHPSIATGVETVSGDPNGRFWFLKNGRVYTFGATTGDFNPLPISGPLNEVRDIKQLEVDGFNGQAYALKENGELLSWPTSGGLNATVKTHSISYLSLESLFYSGNGGKMIYGITEAGHLVNPLMPNPTPLPGSPIVYPEGHVPPLQLDIPIATTTLDAFNRHVIELEFGDDTVKQYSLDNGENWTYYNAPVVLNEEGIYLFRARSGDGEGNYSQWLELTVDNAPIQIEEGYPLIIDQGDGEVTFEPGTIHGLVISEIDVDREGFVPYSGTITLPPGTYTVTGQIRNGEHVLASDTQTIMVAEPTPSPTPTPTSTPEPTPVPSEEPTPDPTETREVTPTPTPDPIPAPTIDPSWGSPIGSQDVTFTVLSGGFNSQFNGLMLDTVTISTTHPYQQINSVTNSVIEDSRGNGAGWNYSLQITDFISDPVFDAGLGTSDLVVKIPSTALSVDVTDASILVGQPSVVASKGKYTFGTEAIVLAHAGEFEGMGQYQVPMSYTLRVPDKVEVVYTGADSKYEIGKLTGLRVGIYRSQFTFTLASGI